jgi:hypothetical protein
MTPEMVAKARKNAERGGLHNVEFRLGEIEHRPVLSDSADAISYHKPLSLDCSLRQVVSVGSLGLRQPPKAIREAVGPDGWHSLYQPTDQYSTGDQTSIASAPDLGKKRATPKNYRECRLDQYPCAADLSIQSSRDDLEAFEPIIVFHTAPEFLLARQQWFTAP